MVILAPENGQRKLPPVGPPEPTSELTEREIIMRDADKFRTRAAQQRAFVAAGRVTVTQKLTGGAAGGAGKNTTPLRPAAITKPAAFFPPPPPPPAIPPPIAKVPKLPALRPLPAPPLPPAIAPLTVVGGGGSPGTAVGGGGAAGGGILLLIGLAVLASFGKRK